MSEHTLWSPSSLHRRLVCIGSANAEEGLPDETSDVAAEGTCAHAVREKCLLEGRDVEDFVGDVVEADGFTFEVTRDWVKFLQPGIDRLRESGGKLFVEYNVPLDAWMPGESGTLDAGVVLSDLIIIEDLKFGRDPVSAVKNVQMMAYALGFWEAVARHITKATRFLLRIDQPRAFGGGSEWYVSLDELIKFGENLAQAYIAGQDPNAPRVPEPDACKYCKASDHCAELAYSIFDVLGISEQFFNEEDIVIPESERLSVDHLGKILFHAKMIKKALEKYEERGKSELHAGKQVPLVKLVEGVGKREWADPKAAEEWLLDKLPQHQVYKRDLISVAEAERTLGTRNWKKAQDLIATKLGAPMLVPHHDSRPALIPVVNYFDDIDEMEDLIGGEVDDLI